MQTALGLQRKIPNIHQIMNGNEVREDFQEEPSCRMSSGGQAAVLQNIEYGVGVKNVLERKIACVNATK